MSVCLSCSGNSLGICAMECLGRIPSFPQRSGPFTHTTICMQHEHVAQQSMETHVRLCGLNLIAQFMRSSLWATQSKFWFTWGCVTKSLKQKLPLSVRHICFSPRFYLTTDCSHFLWLFSSLALLPPSLECNFSLTLWLISPTLTTPTLSILYRRTADPDSHTAQHTHTHTHTRLRSHTDTHRHTDTHTHTHTHTHTLLRHSPVVWPGTTRQLFLLSCHVSHDVKALLCVTGWRLTASCVGGKHNVGECRSCVNESWLKWSTDPQPSNLQSCSCVFLFTAL